MRLEKIVYSISISLGDCGYRIAKEDGIIILKYKIKFNFLNIIWDIHIIYENNQNYIYYILLKQILLFKTIVLSKIKLFWV